MKRVIVAAALAFVAGVWLGASLDQWQFFDPARDWLAIMAAWDWTAISAVITAVGTLVLAAFAIRASADAARTLEASTQQATASSIAAQAASDAVIAANREADASARVVEEMRADRETSLEPRIAFTEGLNSGATVTLTVRNVGRGPALACFAASHRFDDRHSFLGSKDFEVGTNEAPTVELSAGPNDFRSRLVAEDQPLNGVDQVFVIVYADMIGNRRRTILHGGQLSTEVWHHRDGAPPEWATWVDRA